MKYSKIHTVFQKCKEEKRACFIAYLCAGDPNFEFSLEACKTLIESGVDILELGVPFTDPLADGLTNQLAAQRALESGMNNDKVFNLVKAIREYSSIPIVFYTYFNLVFSTGIDKYISRSRDAGVDALLTLDLPPEEASDYLNECRKKSMQTVFIVSPTTPEKRIKKICDVTTAFVYYVSREGVTGEQSSIADGVASKIKLIKEFTELPVVGGFGISNSSHVKKLSKFSDGVVVGSSIVNCIAGNFNDIEKIKHSLNSKIKSLTDNSALQS